MNNVFMLIFLRLETLSWTPFLTHFTLAERDEKFISLFNIVRFKNAACQANFDPRNGTCLSASECEANLGISSGRCASGFGICCVFETRTCGSNITRNNTYVSNPAFPKALPGTVSACNYVINADCTGICSLRLDFDRFDISGPMGRGELNGGECTEDTFRIEGAPIICGLNTGAHVYVDVNDQTLNNGVDLRFQFNGMSQRRWRIRVSQLECDNPGRPRPGCLQYYSEPQGRLRTFNFDGKDSSHLAQQRYAICIRRNANTCCMEYRVCEDVEEAFTLGISANAASKTNNLCNEDFITIEGSSSLCERKNNVVLSNRYCGTHFNDSPTGLAKNAIICDCTEPFEVRIKTDQTSSVPGKNTNRGLCLDYRSLPCV